LSRRRCCPGGRRLRAARRRPPACTLAACEPQSRRALPFPPALPRLLRFSPLPSPMLLSLLLFISRHVFLFTTQHFTKSCLRCALRPAHPIQAQNTFLHRPAPRRAGGGVASRPSANLCRIAPRRARGRTSCAPPTFGGRCRRPPLPRQAGLSPAFHARGCPQRRPQAPRSRYTQPHLFHKH
jgi:hypothetical protein